MRLQVKICSTIGNSWVHWIDIAFYIPESKVRVTGSIKQERKNFEPRFLSVFFIGAPCKSRNVAPYENDYTFFIGN